MDTRQKLMDAGYIDSDAKNVLLELALSFEEAYKYRGRNRTRTLYSVVYVTAIHDDGTYSGFTQSNVPGKITGRFRHKEV